MGGPVQLRRYSNSLRAGRSGDRIPLGAIFSAPVQTVPGSHPMGTGSFPGVKWPTRGVDRTPRPHRAPRLKKEYSYYLYSHSGPPPLVLGLIFFSNIEFQRLLLRIAAWRLAILRYIRCVFRATNQKFATNLLSLPQGISESSAIPFRHWCQDTNGHASRRRRTFFLLRRRCLIVPSKETGLEVNADKTKHMVVSRSDCRTKPHYEGG